jgi:hypothetical protein
MDNPTKFTPDMLPELTRTIKMEELAERYKQLLRPRQPRNSSQVSEFFTEAGPEVPIALIRNTPLDTR